jgi:hypothetical protein
MRSRSESLTPRERQDAVTADPDRDVVIRVEIGAHCDRVCMSRTDGERVTPWNDLAYDEARAVLKAVRRALDREPS